MIPEQHAYLEAGQCFKMACALLLHDFVNEILWGPELVSTYL